MFNVQNKEDGAWFYPTSQSLMFWDLEEIFETTYITLGIKREVGLCICLHVTTRSFGDPELLWPPPAYL